MRAAAASDTPRRAVVATTALCVLAPILLIAYQSFLDAPFFDPRAKLSLWAYGFVFGEADFWRALGTTAALAVGMTAISVPLGALLAFLIARTDMPGRGFVEPMLLVPIFLSPLVLAFGYVVSMGPVGFVTIWWKTYFGPEPWDIYSFTSLVVVAGLTHAPHVYLYASAALKSLPGDLEEAARVTGAKPARIARDVSIPMIQPALLFSGVLIFFLGFEVFGLPLILGDPQGLLVLSTYLYKLTNKLGVPSYQLMAVVVMVILAVALPLVFLQRRLLRTAQRFVAVKGKAVRTNLVPLRGWRWPALLLILGWFFVTVALPMAGLILRSFVSSWGIGISLGDVLTLDNYAELFEDSEVVHAIVNTVLIATVGGALSIACYTLLGLAQHRWASAWARFADYIVMLPRAMPGIVAGLAIFWVFLFTTPLAPLRTTLFAVWVAYSLVWLAYGLRLIQSALLQVAPELEEAARVVGAGQGRAMRDVTVPLIKNGMLAAWLLILLIFVREYSTAVYLLGPGTEVIGSLVVSRWAGGAVDIVTCLSCVNVALISIGLLVALRLGVKLHG
jgi:iron(III) transport system permease protein